jgi:hypothetical protein
MKKILILLVVAYGVAIAGGSQLLNAAAKRSVPKWISDKGFWVVESNIETAANCTLYFYNNQKELVYKEEVRGKPINLTKRKTKMILKKVLEQSVQDFDRDHRPAQNEMRVMGLL